MAGTVGRKRGIDSTVGAGKGCSFLRSGLMGHRE